MPVFILAHAGLGQWDEVIFGGIAVIFTLLMIYSWVVGRNFEPELVDEDEHQSGDT